MIEDRLTSSEDALLFEDPSAQEAVSDGRLQSGDRLWEYLNKGTINGYPVSEDARGLHIQSDDELEAVLEPTFSTGVSTFWLSPEYPEDLQKYAELKQADMDRNIVIIDELKQYDASKSAFLVLVTYNRVVFELNRRYEYLREEL